MRLEEVAGCAVIIVDIHAEATAEKAVLARYLDGKVQAVFGTHTHVPTADEQVLPRGTGFITDVGMCGPHDSIIGREVKPVTEAMRTAEYRRQVAKNDLRLNGAVFTICKETGRLQVERARQIS